jgi:CrcB protein
MHKGSLVKIYLAVGISGSIGTILRYAVAEWTASFAFPLNTVVVNLLGSFILGWFITFIPVRADNVLFRAAIATGLIGSFTTFSAFSVDMIRLLTSEQWFKSAGYFSISFLGGLLFAWVGYAVAQQHRVNHNAVKGSSKR